MELVKTLMFLSRIMTAELIKIKMWVFKRIQEGENKDEKWGLEMNTAKTARCQ